MILPTIKAVALLAVVFLVVPARPTAGAGARDTGLSVPAGLRGAVAFWQQIFSRHDSGTVLFFDPYDHATVYATLKIADTAPGRAAIENERLRILADYDLEEQAGRLRTQRGAREQFLGGLRVAGRYLPEIKKIFRDREMPTDLAYLPLVESSFNTQARSPVGAAGIWQFMPETGKKFFLRIDDTIDDRLDPIASTRAAARLLKQNYQILGSWPLAITAYNHGTEGMFRAIQSTGSRDLSVFIRRYKSPSFGFASQNFYAEFLAAVAVAKNSERHFPFLRPDRPVGLREIARPHALPVGAALSSVALSERQFFEWNPALNRSVTTMPAGFRVKLPAEKADSFMAAQQVARRAGAAKRNIAGAKPAAPAKAKTQLARSPKGQGEKLGRPPKLAAPRASL